MLLEQDMKIYEVADRLGFESAFYFSKVFKKVEGISPREFIQNIIGPDGEQGDPTFTEAAKIIITNAHGFSLRRPKAILLPALSLRRLTAMPGKSFPKTSKSASLKMEKYLHYEYPQPNCRGFYGILHALATERYQDRLFRRTGLR